MNPHLELLLSRVYDGALAPEHLSDLRKSGLTDATIAANLIRSVPPATISRLLGFDLPKAVRSALLFPFRSSAGGFVDHPRVKIFPALTDREGHTVKYLQPRGSRPRLYFVAGCLGDVLEGDGPLYFVEGEKKALAVAQLGLAAVGFCGIEGWHPRGTTMLLEDFDAIRLEGRVVKLVPDGDWQTNPDVDRGVRRFARALHARGAVPRLLVLPAPSVEAA
jgi:hypothetical protein